MDDYDEDLGENNWFLAFTHNHKLFTQVTSERWTICVPKTSSWKGGDEAPKTFSPATFESHCIKFESEATPKRDDSDHEGQQKHINKYITFNGKTLLIEGSKMICGSGFVEKATSFDSRSGQLDLPSGFNHYARILFEETYFNSNDQSYKVLCISRPLELPLAAVPDAERPGDEALLSPPGEHRFCKLHGYHLWSLASNAEKLKHNIDARITAYIKNPGTGKAGNVQSQSSVEEGWEAVEMSEMDNIQACAASAQNIFNNCLQIVLKDSKIRKDTELPSAMDAVKYAVERYVLQEIYGSLFRQLSSFVAQQEAAFNKKARNLSDIQLRDLGVDEKYWLSLPKAKRQLLKINKCCTPQDKLSCLQQTVTCITAKQETEVSALGSDDLLPIFIYLVIKSNIPNWITNLVFLRHFQLMPVLGEQYSFYMTTLEAAIEHIKQGGVQGTPDQIMEKMDSPDASPLEQFFQNVRDGNLEAIKEILIQSAKERKVREQKMCHPLCSCDKCSELKRRSINKSAESQLVTVQMRNDKGQTALHVAAISGQHEVIDLLVERGAELNAVDYHGSTPLHTAAECGSQSVVFLLLHHGANANTVDNNNNTPLHLCCQRGHEACVKAFLYFDPTSSVVTVDAANDEGDTPLHIASRWGYEGVVSALIESGASINTLNRRRQSAVDVSHNSRVSNTIKIAASQVIRIVKTLKHLQPVKESGSTVKAGKTEERKDRRRSNTPKELENTLDNAYIAKQVEKLLRAVSDNDINMVKFLCGWQTKEEEKNSENTEPSACHPLCQCTKCHPLSHEHVLHANSANQERYSGLMIAAKNGFEDMSKLFLGHGASVNAKTKKHGYSSLHFAAEKGHAKVAGIILSQDCANADVRDLTGSTPLYKCAIYNFPECAVVLLKKGASVNIRNRNGDTPLHAAVKWKNIEVIKIFLDHGALVYYKNNNGQTPIDFAEKDTEIWSVLISQSNLEEGVLAFPVVSISPHSVLTPSSGDVMHPSSGGFITEAAQDESASLLDEALADGLYDKFTDPAPPTPPPAYGASATGGSDFGFASLEGTEENVVLVEDKLQKRLFEENLSVEACSASGRESDDTTSDIFRDLLANDSAPTTLGAVDEQTHSVSSSESGGGVSGSAQGVPLLDQGVTKGGGDDDQGVSMTRSNLLSSCEKDGGSGCAHGVALVGEQRGLEADLCGLDEDDFGKSVDEGSEVNSTGPCVNNPYFEIG